tara:strand:+ start:263 stop:520 length:258 start_codon:yes stop_codon:yes gene_type:complete
MKKLTLTESQLTKIIAQVINEQVPADLDGNVIEPNPLTATVSPEEGEMEAIHAKLKYLETRLHELQDDYSRKIGFGDHHVISHDH